MQATGKDASESWKLGMSSGASLPDPIDSREEWQEKVLSQSCLDARRQLFEIPRILPKIPFADSRLALSADISAAISGIQMDFHIIREPH